MPIGLDLCCITCRTNYTRTVQIQRTHGPNRCKCSRYVLVLIVILRRVDEIFGIPDRINPCTEPVIP